MTAPFEDTFDRPLGNGAGDATGSATGSATGDALASQNAASSLGPDWAPTPGSPWQIENGRLCAQGARNKGIWLNRVLPVNARIEFDATSYGSEGDIKAELWGDGRSAATGISYTNATSYIAIFGGWKNSMHVLARINEHGTDRQELRVDPTSDDTRQKPVAVGQTYHFRVERSDGKKVRWFMDGAEFLSFDDPDPLVGAGHDHFGFNNWQVKVCYDNVRIAPL
jgi:hypothetical protein